MTSALRRLNRSIGGSNIASFIRAYTSATTISAIDEYLKKTFESEPFEGNVYTEIGKVTEELIIEGWKQKGLDVKESNIQELYADYKETTRGACNGLQLVATPDMVLGDDCIVEIKTKCTPSIKPPVTAQHILQLVYYMAMSDRPNGKLVYYHPNLKAQQIQCTHEYNIQLGQAERSFFKYGIHRLCAITQSTFAGGLVTEETRILASILYDFKRYYLYEPKYTVPVINAWSSYLDELMQKIRKQ